MLELSGNDSVSVLALRFIILSATHASEVLQAQWQEIDLEAAIWTATRIMVPGGAHSVPLSDTATAILEALPPH